LSYWQPQNKAYQLGMLSWFIKINETYFDHKHRRHQNYTWFGFKDIYDIKLSKFKHRRHQKNIVFFWVYKMNQSVSKFEQKRNKDWAIDNLRKEHINQVCYLGLSRSMKHILITNTKDIRKILSLFGSTKWIKVYQNLNKKVIKQKLYLFRSP